MSDGKSAWINDNNWDNCIFEEWTIEQLETVYYNQNDITLLKIKSYRDYINRIRKELRKRKINKIK